jgi:Tfp pilus assembly protein PilF
MNSSSIACVLLPCCCSAQVAIGIGQLSWAEQCFRLAIALEPSHGEALNNLGVLESRKGQLQQVRRANAACQTGYG